MHYDENNRQHPHHREQQQRREQRQPYQEEHFNDFRSRWGDPAPLFAGRRDEWQTREESHSPRGRHPGYRREWLPDQQRGQERDHRRQDYDNRPPVWQQRDTHFNPDNQHANDRWQDDSYMPDPNYRRHNRQFPHDGHPDDRWR